MLLRLLKPDRRWVVLLLLVSFSGTGCVRRRLTVRSNPAGALVYLDDQEIGLTPVSTSVTYYGTRKIRLQKDGFETATLKRNFRPPWYEWPVIEFFSENLWPREIRDERVVDVEMQPQLVVPGEQLLERGEQLRQQGRHGVATPLLPADSPAPLPAAPELELLPAPGGAEALPPPTGYSPELLPPTGSLAP